LHGSSVAIFGRSIDKLNNTKEMLENEKNSGNKIFCIQCDVSKEENVKNAIDEALKMFENKLDLLVNCAAGNFLCPISQLSFNAFKRVIEIDLFGV